MGKIERAPGWILKYKERIENGTLTVEDILEAENRIREKPIRISSVTRAINAMGHPITGLRSGKREEPIKELVEPEEIVKGPEWLQKYREGIGNKSMTVMDILEAENKIREKQIKLITVTRAINAMGYPITNLHNESNAEIAEPGTMERWPAWLQKYRERIEEATITTDDILEEGSKIWAEPLKISSVIRAIKAMGYPGLRRGKGEKEEIKQKLVETTEEIKGAERGPSWLQKYRERIVKKTITVEDILEAENKIRENPIRISSVTRAINTMGYPLTGLRRGSEEEVKKVEKAKKVVAVDYSSRIGKISEETGQKFIAIKKSWEIELGKSLQDDYFMNVLLALAKLLEHGKTLTLATAK